ncbi:MAG TPA: POTRA domain-containing protein, partial [Usitatibacter sp.]|nr:POTRA domain-containing protein [Usitatibacter sp.]
MRPLAIVWLALAIAASSAALAQEEEEAPRASGTPLAVTWEAPTPLRQLYEKFLKPPQPEAGERRAISLRPWVREVRRRVPEIAAAEGYFSATVEIDFDSAAREHATVTVTPGPRTVVTDVKIDFEGDLAGEGAARELRREELRRQFAMKAGAPFRSADWDGAKVRIVDDLGERDYAAGRLASSKAEVDAEAATAQLHLVLDSGPKFTLGDVHIHGIERYSESLVRRVVSIRHGDPFSMDTLGELQRRLQSGPWFSTVTVDVERDPLKPNLVPVIVTVAERPSRDVGLSLGYGTDDG